MSLPSLLLPARATPAVPPPSTGVALGGVDRRGGRISDREGAAGVRRRTEPAVAPRSGQDRLLAMVLQLRSPSSSSATLARRWQAAVRTSMAHKQALYQRERASLEAEIDDAQAKAATFVRQARAGGDNALADAQTPSWDVAKEVNARWQRLVAQSVSMDRLIGAARGKYDAIHNTTDFSRLRLEFAAAIEELVADYSMQSILLENVADLIDSFVNHPLVAQHSMLNFVLVGNPGAGKTRLATSLSAVLGKLGLYAYDQLVVAGRSDFVAEYEGQTATKTRNFLISNIEKVIFLDEAYSLTTWESAGGATGCEGERTLSAYSGEAVTEIVAFLSQRAGSVCFIAAGYEKEMLHDFLPANPGLARRFHLRVWLMDYTASQLVEIYLGALAAAMSDSATRLTAAMTRTYFTQPALAFLADILESSQAKQVPKFPLLRETFAAQAGAMATLANTTAVLIASSNRHGQIGLDARGQDTWAIGLVDMHNILVTLLQQHFGPYATNATDEVLSVASSHGWFAGGLWQVPQGIGESSSDGGGRSGRSRRVSVRRA